MKSYEQIAKAMYAAFIKERKARGSCGTDYLSWEGLSPDQQACWIAAARQAAAELALVH